MKWRWRSIDKINECLCVINFRHKLYSNQLLVYDPLTNFDLSIDNPEYKND